MISDRLKNLLKVFIFALFASGVALVLLFQIQNYNRMQVYLATEAAMPTHKPNGELKVYKNETAGYTFVYPGKLSISTSAGEVELSHQIPYKNTGECNMKGDIQIYDYLTDFKVNISIVKGSVAQVVKQISPYMPLENFSEDTLKISPGFIDAYEMGSLKGFSIYEGVEGCGHIIYYFALDNGKVLVVKRNLIEKLSSIVTPEVNQDVLITPGVINPGQADLIFSQLLKSFQYNPQVSSSVDLDISTWKTYKNEEYGFEFKYPNDWLLRDKIFEADCEAKGLQDCMIDIVNHNISINYFDVGAQKAPTYCQYINGIKDESCESLFVHGKIINVDWDWGTEILNNNQIVVMEFNVNNVKINQTKKELLKNILLTFKFIDTFEPKLIGGDKDAGGCLVGAGYSWCEVKKKCLRVWEEKCE